MKLVIIGTGGLSKSISSSSKKVFGYIDEFKNDKTILYNYIDDSNVKKLKNKSFIVAIGNNKNRLKWFKILEQYSLKITNVIDKTSNIDKSVKIGKGNFIGKNVVINTNSTIGHNCILNSGVIIEHSAIIGNNVNISPGAVLNGDVKIGDDTWIGSNSTIFGQVNIGKNCIIGAGSIIRKDVPDNYVVVGKGEFLKYNEK